MDTTAVPERPLSIHSNASSVTLVGTSGQERIQLAQQHSSDRTAGPPRPIFYRLNGRPNPNAQRKPRSKLRAFMSKLQSPAVRATTEAREREKLEDERLGIKTLTPLPMPLGTSIIGAACYYATTSGL